MDLEAYLRERQQLVNNFLEGYFDISIRPHILKESVMYSLTAGGKRLRPILCIASYEACGGKTKEVIPYASALELIHTYSLIHDDLPAMDNDDLRRGKPTNHKVFGEGIAILAGDGLLTEAFYLLSSNPSCFETDLVLRVINEVANAAGIKGMVGGQAADLLCESMEPNEEILSFIHSHKTASLIKASIRTGAILAGCDEKRLALLSEYGMKIGLAFQIVDDILDVEGDSEVLGKSTGSDEKKKKMTYPSLYGIDRSKQLASKLVRNCINDLDIFDGRAEPLREIARFILNRKK